MVLFTGDCLTEVCPSFVLIYEFRFKKTIFVFLALILWYQASQLSHDITGTLFLSFISSSPNALSATPPTTAP